MAADIPYVERRAAWTESSGPPTAVAEPKPEVRRTGEEQLITLPVPEHLHRLWLALGLDDE